MVVNLVQIYQIKSCLCSIIIWIVYVLWFYEHTDKLKLNIVFFIYTIVPGILHLQH